MSDSNRYGRVVSPRDVENAVVASLNVWIDDCLGEAERLYGYEPNSIERPRGIIRRSEWTKWPEDQIPVIVVINAGLAQQPIRRANGTYDALWRVGVCPIVSDVDQDATRDLAEAYTVAVRLALLQHKMLKSPAYPDGFADFTSWIDEQYNDMPELIQRSMNSGRVVLDIGVENVLTEQAGPRTPTVPASQDPGPWLTVSETPSVIVTPLNPTEAVT